MDKLDLTNVKINQIREAAKALNATGLVKKAIPLYGQSKIGMSGKFAAAMDKIWHEYETVPMAALKVYAKIRCNGSGEYNGPDFDGNTPGDHVYRRPLLEPLLKAGLIDRDVMEDCLWEPAGHWLMHDIAEAYWRAGRESELPKRFWEEITGMCEIPRDPDWEENQPRLTGAVTPEKPGPRPYEPDPVVDNLGDINPTDAQVATAEAELDEAMKRVPYKMHLDKCNGNRHCGNYVAALLEVLRHHGPGKPEELALAMGDGMVNTLGLFFDLGVAVMDENDVIHFTTPVAPRADA